VVKVSLPLVVPDLLLLGVSLLWVIRPETRKHAPISSSLSVEMLNKEGI